MSRHDKCTSVQCSLATLRLEKASARRLCLACVVEQDAAFLERRSDQQLGSPNGRMKTIIVHRTMLHQERPCQS